MYKQFLSDLWGTKTSGYILIWAYNGSSLKKSYWFQTSEEAAAYLDKAASMDNINYYVGVGLSPKDYGAYARCPKKDIVGIAGLYVDIDIQSDAHAKPNLPANIDEARQLLNELPQTPSYIIHSGHGIQAWWLFREVWMFDSDAEREAAEQLERRLIYYFKDRAKQHGWDVDSVYNLDRLLRIPGTKNWKHTPPARVAVLERNEIRWNPSDFEYLPEAIDDLADSGENTKVDSLTLRADTNPPFDKFQLLVEMEPKFKLSWEKKRKDFQDQSASSYDMSLASFACNYGWTDQEIADLMIAFRRKHNEDLKLRQDYYQRTIARAKREKEKREAETHIREYAESVDPENPVEISQEEKEEIIRKLSAIFGVTITKITKFMSDPPLYRLETNQGEITLGEVDNLIGQSKLRSKIAAATGRYLPKFKADQWDNCAQALLDCCIEVEVGEEATEKGEIMDLLKQYLESKPPLPEDEAEEAAITRTPVRYDGKIAIFGSDFRRWIRTVQQENISAKQMGMLLRSIGGEPGKIDTEIAGKRTSRSVWFLENIV